MSFQKGKSGNPRGRPKAATIEEIRAMARRAAPDMVRKLISIAETSESDRSATAAASAVLDRAYGKPATMLGDDEGNAIGWVDVIRAARERSS